MMRALLAFWRWLTLDPPCEGCAAADASPCLMCGQRACPAHAFGSGTGVICRGCDRRL